MYDKTNLYMINSIFQLYGCITMQCTINEKCQRMYVNEYIYTQNKLK